MLQSLNTLNLFDTVNLKQFSKRSCLLKSLSTVESTEAVAQRCCVKKCSQKFRKIYRKTPAPESLFYQNCRLRLRPTTLLKERLWHRCFPVNFAKSLTTTFLKKTIPVAASKSTKIERKTFPYKILCQKPMLIRQIEWGVLVQNKDQQRVG